jgi:hypothetical protein
MADAPVADAAREAETPPEEPLSEDETCIDSGAFTKHHGFTTGPPGKRVYLAILKAMGKKGLEKTTLALLPKGDNSTKSKWLYEHLDSNAALKRRLLKYRHDAIKVWNKDRRAEQEESSSHDQSASAAPPERVRAAATANMSGYTGYTYTGAESASLTRDRPDSPCPRRQRLVDARRPGRDAAHGARRRRRAKRGADALQSVRRLHEHAAAAARLHVRQVPRNKPRNLYKSNVGSGTWAEVRELGQGRRIRTRNRRGRECHGDMWRSDDAGAAEAPGHRRADS